MLYLLGRQALDLDVEQVEQLGGPGPAGLTVVHDDRKQGRQPRCFGMLSLEPFPDPYGMDQELEGRAS